MLQALLLQLELPGSLLLVPLQLLLRQLQRSDELLVLLQLQPAAAACGLRSQGHLLVLLLQHLLRAWPATAGAAGRGSAAAALVLVLVLLVLLQWRQRLGFPRGVLGLLARWQLPLLLLLLPCQRQLSLQLCDPCQGLQQMLAVLLILLALLRQPLLLLVPASSSTGRIRPWPAPTPAFPAC